MSVQATYPTNSAASPTTALSGLTRWLRQTLNAYRLERDLSRLSDHYLRDVGIEQRSVSDAFERSTVRNRLLEAGWRYSQRC